MRTGFIAVFMIKVALSFPLRASPVYDIESSPAKGITQLLERLSASLLSPVTRHYACQASTGEYGLEIQLWDSRSYCQYLSADKYKMSEEFTPLYLDEKTLNDSVEEFLQENSRQSKNYWVFEDNNLRYVYNSGVRKEHILLPRESLLSSGSGSGMNISDGTDSPKSSNGGEETDVGATIGGASLVILALMAIVGFIVEANKHCVLRGCQWVWGKLSDISFR